MAKRPIDVLKSYFETGDTPTEQQFADLIDSFFHKDGSISISNITGLQAELDKLDNLQISDIEGLQTALDDLANIEISDVNGLQTALTNINNAISAIITVNNNQQTAIDNNETRIEYIENNYVQKDGDKQLSDENFTTSFKEILDAGVIAEAPNDGHQYVRQNQSWEVIEQDSSIVYIKTSDDPQTVFDASPAGSVLKFVSGMHIHGINNNSRTQNAILYVDKPMSIELMEGAVLKLANSTIPLQTTPEITTNQGVDKLLNDMSIGATSNYTGGAKVDYYIRIVTAGTPDKFEWGVFNSDSTYTQRATNVNITGSEQTLENGVKIQFGATTGHNVGSIWYVSYDGQEHYGIRVGSGFHASYIEDVNIYGKGTIDLNSQNNIQPSLLVANTASCVLVHGRVRRCFTKEITMKNAHRTFMAYGDNNSVYGANGSIDFSGTSFDAEYISVENTQNINTSIQDFGILLGHPAHRGLLKYVKCNRNYVESLNTPIEPNYLLREYEILDNLIKGTSIDTNAAIHCWRRSDNGLISRNALIGDTTGTKLPVLVSAPGAWETAKNVTLLNNYNLNNGKIEPYPPFNSSANDPYANLIAQYPLLTNSNDSVAGRNGTDTSIVYASEAQFNNSTSKIQIADNNIFSFTDGTNDKPFTFTVKFKFTDTSSGLFFSKYDNTSPFDGEYYIYYSAGFLYAILSTNAGNQIGARAAFTPVVGTYYHLAVTYSGNKLNAGLKIYIDAVLLTTDSSSNLGTYTGMVNGTAKVTIGTASWTTAHQFGGSMKDLRLYSEEKSGSGIITIKNL